MVGQPQRGFTIGWTGRRFAIRRYRARYVARIGWNWK